MNRFKPEILIVGLVFLSLTVSTAFSQGQDQMRVGDSKGACKSDIEQFCKDIKPGGGRIRACLRGNEDRLSQSCRDHIAQERERNREFRQACKGDIQKFCSNVRPGHGRIIECLRSKGAETSEPCISQLAR